MDHKDLVEVLLLHGLYLVDNPEGKRADLYKTDLYEADLTEANLNGAGLIDVRGAVFFIADGYTCIVQEGFITIGCQRHTKEAWAAFTDTDIEEMEGDPILWNKHKATIFSMNV